jgi:hypothetical protein
MTAGPALAQNPPSTLPPGLAPPRQPEPVRQLPSEVTRGAVPRPGAKLPDLSAPSGLAPGSVTPPSQPLAQPATEVPAAPVPQRFENSALRLKLEGGSWQLWGGSQLLKDFGPSPAEAREALQLFRDLRVNARGSIGGVFEYWLTDDAAPSSITRYRQVVAFDPASLRVEALSGQWVLRDAHVILYNFGRSESDARQALAVCRQFGFNELGYVGHPTPALKYLLRNPNPPAPKRSARDAAPLSARLQAAETPSKPLVLPDAGTVGDRVPLDARRLDLRRESGEWLLYAGKTPLGRFGVSERDAGAAVQLLQQYRVTELCRLGQSEFGFFLSNGRAPEGGSIVGLSARPLRADQLSVRQIGGSWAVCEGTRTLWDFGERADDARHALAAIRHYGFNYAVPVGNGRLGNVHLLVKAH